MQTFQVLNSDLNGEIIKNPYAIFCNFLQKFVNVCIFNEFQKLAKTAETQISCYLNFV